MGSRLDSKAELQYYSAIASIAQQLDSPLAGWIWWAYNANSAGEQTRPCSGCMLGQQRMSPLGDVRSSMPILKTAQHPCSKRLWTALSFMGLHGQLELAQAVCDHLCHLKAEGMRAAELH
jgi:hypothetical protein